MSIYTNQHYEDIAEVLLNTNPVMRLDPPYTDRDSLQRATIVAIIQRFANLFAADNPAYCTHCSCDGTIECVCITAGGRTYDEHNFEGGFDRKQFLVACGLEPETDLCPLCNKPSDGDVHLECADYEQALADAQ